MITDACPEGDPRPTRAPRDTPASRPYRPQPTAPTACRNRPNNFQPPPPELELPCFVDIWTPLVVGNHPDLTPLMEVDPAGAAGLAADAAAAAAAMAPNEASQHGACRGVAWG